MSLKEKLEKFTPEEIDQLKELLGVPQEEKPKKKKQKRPRKNKFNKQQDSAGVVDGPKQPKRPKSTKRKSAQKIVRRGQQKGGSGNTPMRKEPMDTTSKRTNLFVTQKLKVAGSQTEEERIAIKADKVCARLHQPLERMRDSSLMEVECIECSNWFEVPIKEVRHDVTTGEVRYRCDRCELNRK